MAALDWVKKYCNNDEDICSLSRDNPTSNAMRRDYNGQYMNDKLIEEFINVDKSSSSNKYRSKVIISCLRAVEYAREGDIKKAIKELESLERDINDTDERKKIALKSLYLLLGKYDNYKNKPLYDFYQLVKNNVKTEISKLGKGAAATFYEANTYEQLALCVNISEDFSKHKTIHKSKGDEFDNVLIVFNSSDKLEVFLNPDLKKNEEHRISYVALSRARERLFITVPEINDDLTRRLKKIFGIELI